MKLTMQLQRFLVLFFYFTLTVPTCLFSATTIIKTDYNFCSESYPSGYINTSFTICAANAAAFNANQVNKFMDFVTPVNFTYNTSGPLTISFAANQAIYSASAVFINSRRIRVLLSTLNLTDRFDTLTLTFQVRAITAPITSTTSLIRRTDSTDLITATRFTIDGSNAQPSVSLGRLNSRVKLTVLTCDVSHPITTEAYVGSANNQMLQLALVVSGGCGSLTISNFRFNTDGGNGTGTTLNSDIALARLYYTGTSTVFSTATTFGTSANPSGEFDISGTRTLTTSGTYYFWLVYNVSSLALDGNLLDARMINMTIDGVVNNTVNTPAPIGSRTIATQYFYSLESNTWNSTSAWSNTVNGTSCSCVPNGHGYVIIRDGHTITVNGSYTVDVIDIQNGGRLNDNGTNVPTIRQQLLTSGTGVFNATSSWVFQNNVTLGGTGTSTATKALTISGNLSIANSATLSNSGTATLTVAKGISINGTLAMSTLGITLNGTNAKISGTGTITGTGTVTLTNAKQIDSSANLTISQNVTVSSGNTITNNGTVTIKGNLTGGSITSTWLNQSGSRLYVAGTLLSTGTLNASVANNEVIYNGTANQTIKATTYANLTLSNESISTKTLGGAIIVNEDLNILGATTLDVSASNFSLTLLGDLSVAATAAINPRNGTFIFNGSSGITGSPTFKNITIAGTLVSSSGIISVSGNFVNNGIFLHNNGSILFNGVTTLSGSAITNLNHISVPSAATLTLHATETDITGNITINGTLNHNNGLVECKGNSILSGANTPVFFKLLMSGSLLTLNTSCTINNSLQLQSGIIATTASTSVTLAATASITGGDEQSFVRGRLIRNVAASGSTVIFFPIGKASRYRPVTLTAIHSSAAAATYTAEMFNNSAQGLGYTLPVGVSIVSPTRYYVINRSGASNLTSATVTFAYGADDGVTDPSGLRIVKTIGSGTAWNLIGGTGSGAGSGTITSAAFTTFSTFALANAQGSGNILPVELSTFYTKCVDDKAVLTWRTESEYMALQFEVERADDNFEFKPIGVVSALGNSLSAQYYSYTDENLSIYHRTYYRLKCVDMDGSYTYSPVIVNACSTQLNPLPAMKIYPQPAYDVAYISWDAGELTSTHIRVFSALGKLLYESLQPAEADFMELNLSDYPAGVYIVDLTIGGTHISRKLLINR